MSTTSDTKPLFRVQPFGHSRSFKYTILFKFGWNRYRGERLYTTTNNSTGFDQIDSALSSLTEAIGDESESPLVLTDSETGLIMTIEAGACSFNDEALYPFLIGAEILNIEPAGEGPIPGCADEDEYFED